MAKMTVLEWAKQMLTLAKKGEGKAQSIETKSYFEGQILILEILIENLQSEALDTTTRD